VPAVVTQRINLAELIGLPEVQMGEVDTVLTVEPRTYDEPALLAEATKNRPDLQAAETEVKAAKSEKSSARFSRFPFLTMGGSVDINTSAHQTSTIDPPGIPGLASPGVQGGGSTTDRVASGQIALSWDFFDGTQADARSAAANARFLRAQDNLTVLKRNLERAREKGFTFYVGPEMEFFYFRSQRNPDPLDEASYFDLTQMDMVSELRKQTILTLEAMGIPVEYSFHELGPSQHEIDLRYTDALTMADNVMTFRLVVKEVAQDLGVYATFMPKPLAHAFGSGMHTHLSLFEGDVNAFHDPGDNAGLSKVGKNFIAGLLRHAPEITAVTNQWVNSYKRLAINSEAPIVGYEAPTYVCWARNNRSALVRVPLAKKGKEDSTRIEFRSPDPACNPYLAFSLMLAAGLKGVDEGYELAAEATNNIFEMTPEERAAAIYRGGLNITTTFDPNLQTLAENARNVLPDTPQGFDASIVSLDTQTGAIRAMVGGKGFVPGIRESSRCSSVRFTILLVPVVGGSRRTRT